jgi:processive 1,2-diacylglycerol beta-glucosyltransferase
MGAQGSMASYYYAQEICKIQKSLHLIVVNNNEYVHTKIETISFPPNISTTLLGFTANISDLMAVSDLCICKSGSVSVFEMIYSNLPMLLDATTTLPYWERFNHTFVKKHGFGQSIKHFQDTQQMITRYLFDSKLLSNTKKNLHNFHKKRFDQNIKNVIAGLL